MKIERAIEILDPEHREHYDDLEEVNEACRMGMEALKMMQRGQIVRPGQWIKPVPGDGEPYCSECKHEAPTTGGLCAEYWFPAFCPSCGADMRKKIIPMPKREE